MTEKIIKYQLHLEELKQVETERSIEKHNYESQISNFMGPLERNLIEVLSSLNVQRQASCREA